MFYHEPTLLTTANGDPGCTGISLNRLIVVLAWSLWAGDVLCNEAEGLFVTLGQERFKELLAARDRA